MIIFEISFFFTQVFFLFFIFPDHERRSKDLCDSSSFLQIIILYYIEIFIMLIITFTILTGDQNYIHIQGKWLVLQKWQLKLSLYHL